MTKTKLSILCDSIIEAGWLIAVVSVPLFFNIYTARTFEPDKITLLRIITAIMVLASLVSTIEHGVVVTRDDGKSIKQRFWEWIKMPFVLPTLIFSLSYIISALLSISPEVSFWGSYQRLQGTYSMLSYIIVFVMIAAHLRTREQIDRLVSIIILTSVPVSLYGIVQKFGLDPLPWAGDVTSRVASTLGNAIFVSSYLIMVMPLTMMRLVKSMAAIVTEEKASWGHTILAAIYIFTIAIQALTVVYSGSRGPILGILISAFFMGLLIIMTLRQLDQDTTPLSIKELFYGVSFIIPIGLASAIGAGFGFALGYGVEQVAEVDQLSILGLTLGALLGMLGLYVYMATSRQGWRWLWLSWLSLAVAGILFILMLNIRGTALDPYIESVRQIPHLNRLTTITHTSGGTAEVRLLIWDAAMNLVVPHEPMGVEGDPNSQVDSLNILRPIFGYGPESMFNAFAYVYPPKLAHVETRGSSADRSHNETMDSLVITGFVGFIAYYFIMVSVFVYGLVWTGWTPTEASKVRLYITLIVSALIGGGLAYFASGDRVFIPLGLPFGLSVGIIVHLIWQGIVGTKHRDFSSNSPVIQNHLLFIGSLGATIGHFIEVHFVFSIAATYTYFWAYRGLMLAIDRMEVAQQTNLANETAIKLEKETVQLENSETEKPVRQSRSTKRGRGRGRRNRQSAASSVMGALSKTGRRTTQSGRLSWEMVLAGYGLALAIIMIILTFDFITPQFEFDFEDSDSMSLLWMYVITWSIGLAIALSDIAIRRSEWSSEINWGRGVALYSVSSLSYFFFYYTVHRLQFGQQLNVSNIQDAINAANVLVNGLLTLFIFLLLLTIIFAVTLAWQQMQRLQTWRVENWWIYGAFTVLTVLLIWWKNFDVVRADIYLKEGERYRGQSYWEQAIALHTLARDIDSDEDFYYLMLALDYQLMAQDTRLDVGQRLEAQRQGEKTALEAREVNPYNPDNTGNMGRYYFTLSQISGDQAERQKNLDLANDFFRKATILAPTNVIYHNLWAQTAYVEQDYDLALKRLEDSLAVDDRYRPTWTLLGDSYVANGESDKALHAHSEGMQPMLYSRDADGFYSFADQSQDLRLNFYISSGMVDELVTEMENVALQTPANTLIQETIAKTYSRAGEQDNALIAYNQALTLRESEQAVSQRYLAEATTPAERNAAQSGISTAQSQIDTLLRETGRIKLSLQDYDNALLDYERVIQNSPNDIESRNALGYIYAQKKEFDKAIQQHQFILQQQPENHESLQNLAVLYQESQQWQLALETAQRAMAVASEEQIPQWEQFILAMQAQLGTQPQLEFNQ